MSDKYYGEADRVVQENTKSDDELAECLARQAQQWPESFNRRRLALCKKVYIWDFYHNQRGGSCNG